MPESAFVSRDDIQSRVGRFERTRRRHGLETFSSSMKILFDKGSLIGTAAVAAVIALLETPMAAGIAAARVEAGLVALNMLEQRYQFHRDRRAHERAYLIHLQEKLGEP